MEDKWDNCVVIQPKKSRMRWCTACYEYHDSDCFFRFHGAITGCMLNRASRAKAIQKAKGRGSDKK